MTVSPASFIVRFPEFASVDSDRIQLFLDDASLMINTAYWGDKADLGQSYLAAHYLVLGSKTEAGSSAPTGAVASRSVDGVSISYANPTINDGSAAYYMSTAYGQRYLAIRKTLGIPAIVI